jgi:hypothetical protein
MRHCFKFSFQFSFNFAFNFKLRRYMKAKEIHETALLSHQIVNHFSQAAALTTKVWRCRLTLSNPP